MRAIVQLHDVEQGSPEWLRARPGKYTGSNAHKLLSNMGDGEYAKAIQQSFSGNFWTKRGHLLEDEALELYEAIHGTGVRRTGFVTNKQYDDCLYSPDGLYRPEIELAPGMTLLLSGLLLEVKCFSEKNHMELARARNELDIPLKIRAQIHYGMLICGLRQAKLIAYNPSIANNKLAYREIPVRYSPAIAANFKRILKGVTQNVSVR